MKMKGCDYVQFNEKIRHWIVWWKITLCFVFVAVLDTFDCYFARLVEITVFAGRVKTTDLVNMLFNFCEMYSGKTLYPYQVQFSKRVIRSVLMNDGEEITALFARQSGKSETISVTVGGLMIMLPQLANMPMFAGDPRLEMFKDGVSVGIFAPGKRQAEITFNRVKARLQCKTALAVLEDPEFNLFFHTSNGQTCTLSNGSFVTCISASDQSNIEGESFKILILEECQDISNYKIRKSIHPMGAAYNASIIKIGTATTFKGDFYDAIQRNKQEYERKKKEFKRRGSNISTLTRNHFEYDYKVASKYNHKYAKYVEAEKKRLGENSDEFRMAYCVSPETLILTADLKEVRAFEVRPGDRLVGFCENGKHIVKETVVEEVGVIERPCCTLKFSDGSSVTCSAEHQWLVRNLDKSTVWKKTIDLAIFDRICRVYDHDTVDLGMKHGLRVINKRFEGVQTVIPIRTSTHTFVANGLASHNCLEWIIERGMFVDIEKFEAANCDPMLERVEYDKKAKHVAGIDVGGKNDSTVITMLEVDWSMPVIMEERTEESGQKVMYEAYNTFVKDWYCISNEPDYEVQYAMITQYLDKWWVVRVVCDATREASLAHRLRANLRCEVIPYIFTTVSKSELYKLFDTEICSGRFRVPCGDNTKNTQEFKSFMKQMGDLQKGWSGSHMVCSHGTGKDDHDDYCLSLDTEILTDRGFIDYGHFTPDTKVARVDDNVITYVTPDRIVHRKYSGYMYNFKSKDLDILVTKNHKLLLNRPRTNDKRDDVVLSQELFNTEGVYGRYTVPVAPLQDLPDMDISDRDIIIGGLFLTEGWVNYDRKNNSYRYCLSQSKRSSRFEQMGELVKSLNLNPYVYTRKDGLVYWTFHTDDNGRFNRLLTEGIHRIPRKWLNEFSVRQLNLLIHTLMNGREVGLKKTFSTNHPKLAQDFQELSHKAGIKTSIRKERRGNQYSCYMMKSDYSRIAEMSRKEYEGYVWCVTVGNGFIVTRRNNKIAVVGNCDSSALAVWGASSKGEENNTETKDNQFMKKTPNEKLMGYKRNRMTARRLGRR